MTKEELFRQIPKVDTLLKEEAIQELCRGYGHGAVVDAIRSTLEELRNIVIKNGEKIEHTDIFENITDKVAKKVIETECLSIRKVYNATGIILHTNLGRAPLGKNQLEAVLETFGGYANLEYNLETGKRGKRWEHYAQQISQVTGSGGAIAVNNNAAAVTLILSALTKGKEVIVSRGELIEIGGRFRIPEVMEQSGVVLRETGCTNRTRISDYEKAINENTGALLKVHTSNYKIMGFAEEVSVEELSELGKKYNLPVIVDLGSGVLVNLEKYGLPHEPTVQETLRKGADLVCFSGDKLLGGPQAGIIAGKKEYIKAMENHPLMRAFRLDKCTIAALEATFREYRDEARAEINIPVLRMISTPLEELKVRAEKIVSELIENIGRNRTGADDLSRMHQEQEKRSDAERNHLSLKEKSEWNNDLTEFVTDAETPEYFAEESRAMLGGGSMPTEEMSSFAVAISSKKESCEELAARMRHLPVPIIAHIKNDKVILDLRTISPEEDADFLSELKSLWK